MCYVLPVVPPVKAQIIDWVRVVSSVGWVVRKFESAGRSHGIYLRMYLCLQLYIDMVGWNLRRPNEAKIVHQALCRTRWPNGSILYYLP